MKLTECKPGDLVRSLRPGDEDVLYFAFESPNNPDIIRFAYLNGGSSGIQTAMNEHSLQALIEDERYSDTHNVEFICNLAELAREVCLT
jgi:hypothetical protein